MYTLSIAVYHHYCVAWALPSEYVGSRVSAAQVKSRKFGFGRGEGICRLVRTCVTYSVAKCPLTLLRSSEDSPCPSTSVHSQDSGKPEALNSNKDVLASPEEDEKTQLLSEGLKLLLAARERVLTLSEQRVGSFYSHILLLLLNYSPSSLVL